MGPEYCWRCAIREDLWASQPLYPGPPPGFSPDGRPPLDPHEDFQPGPFASPPVSRPPSGRSPGSLANLVPGWRLYVLDHSLSQASFAKEFPYDHAAQCWSVILYWRKEVELR